MLPRLPLLPGLNHPEQAEQAEGKKDLSATGSLAPGLTRLVGSPENLLPSEKNASHG